MDEVEGGNSEMLNALPQEKVPIFLYCTVYREMGTSLCGVVQVILRAGDPKLIVLDRDRPVTWEGPLRAI